LLGRHRQPVQPGPGLAGPGELRDSALAAQGMHAE
jgi:hypothetical protein